MSSREPYRFISYDSRDENLVQFYVRTVNNAPYIQFTYISPRDRRWADIIEANDIIFFTQDNVDVASATIAAPYDSENGFRISEVPSPALNEGNYYGIDYSRDRPEEDRDVPVENRGWSPLYGIQYLNFDDPGYSVSNTPTKYFAFRLVDWTSGRGTKPQTGYLGTTGIVADVANAAILTLPPGPRGAMGLAGADGAIWTEGTTLSNGNVAGDMHLFTEAVESGLTNYFQVDGTTAKVEAEAGEVARWDGTKWRFVMVLSTGGLGGIFVDMHDGLRDATEDDYGKIGIGPDGRLYRVKRTANPGHDAVGTFNAYTHAQYRGVAHSRPSNPQEGEIYYNIRIHQWYLFFINRVVSTIDAQPITPVQALGANTVWLGEVDDVYQARHAIQDFDNTKAYYAVYGETLYVLNNSTYTAATTETTYAYRWIEILPDDVVTTAELQATVMDKLLPTYPAAGSRNDKIAKFDGDTLGWEYDGKGLTPQEEAQFDSLVAKTADLLLETRETWVAATDASFLALPADNAQLARVRAGNVPQGLTGWVTDITTTDARVILVRVPVAAQLADYRILLGNDNAVRLDAFGVDATGTQYAYMTSTSLVLQEASRIRLQHHGAATHTRFIGMLADALMARLLPDLPAEGSRDNKVAQFEGDNLVWEALTAGGLTTGQLARLLPTPPSEGDRDEKIAQYVNDVLTWKAIEGFVTEETFRDYRPHTPERGDTLPVRLEPQGTFILQETSHWSDKLYPFYPVGREIVIGGRTFNDIGTIEVSLSSELTPFESTDNPNPAIFSATRVAGIYMRSTNVTATEAGYAWRPKIVLDRALFPSSGGTYNYSGLSIRMRVGYEGFGQYHHASLFHSAFNRDGDNISGAGAVTEIVAGGRTYVCFVPDNSNFHWRQFLGNAANNNAEISFQILKSKSASPVFPPTDPQFLSDDPTTAWVDGTEFVTGLYEGDANGHPVPRILPPLALWNDVVARSDTYIRAADPQARFGVDGNKWFNLANGKGYIKQGGTWVEAADFALQSEIASVPAMERNAPYHWYATGFLPPSGSSLFGGSGSIERISENSVIFYGAENLLAHRDGSRLLFRIDGVASTSSTAAAGGSVKVSVVDSRNAKTEIGTLDLTGSDTTDLPFTFEGEVTALPGNAVRIAFESTGIPTSNLNTWTVSNIKVGATVITNRFLPPLPAEGSRDNKAAIFDGDNLVWETLMSGGLTSGQLARLLPALPAEGSRNDKILRFADNVLGWEDLAAMGLSSAQIARLLPTLPAEGSRNDKFPIFQNDTLMWENFPTITTIAGEWNTIAARTTIAIGTLVRHGGNYYGCIVTHTKSSNGPDGDPTNWQLLSAYQGVWAAGYYHAGSITVRGAGLYLALHNVGNTDPAPDASTNVKWLQINNVEPPARYIELTVNASIAISNDVNVAAVPLTYASALAKSNENTDFLSRNANGNQITLAAGSYELDTHIVINQGGRDSARSTYTVQIFNGATMIDEKTYLDYLRGEAAINLQSVSSSHIFTLSGNANIQVRIKKASTENSGRDFTTAAGGSVIVKRL